jgi:hypothetical protein
MEQRWQIQQQHKAEQRKATTGLIAHCEGAVLRDNADAQHMQHAVEVSVLGMASTWQRQPYTRCTLPREQQTGTPAAAWLGQRRECIYPLTTCCAPA